VSTSHTRAGLGFDMRFVIALYRPPFDDASLPQRSS
jgi:hypothetical protein